jgi:hypothetical protein
MPLTKKSSAGDFISDFRKSDAPQFAGKSKEKRTQMAVAAYLAKKREKKEEVELDEKKGPKIDPAKMAAHMARNQRPKKMSSTQKSLASIRQKAEDVGLDELDKKTYGRYIKKATDNSVHQAMKLATTSSIKKPDEFKKTSKKLANRMGYISKATNKLTASTTEAVDPSDTGGKEETDMAMGQLKFMQHAIEGIMTKVQKDGDMEEWFQNKLTKAHEDLKSLYSYSKGEVD